MSLMQVLATYLPNLRCRKFRIYFLFGLLLVLVLQSFFIYCLLHNIREESDVLLPTSLEVVSLPQNINSKRNHEQELGYNGQFPCEITSKTAQSAIRRASTQFCKSELSHVYCQLKKRNLYPTHLPNYCQRQDSKPRTSLGCFKEKENQKLLSEYGTRLRNLTTSKCIDVCAQSSFPYAAVNWPDKCYCGSQKPSLDHLISVSPCNSTWCDQKSRKYCSDHTEIFDTGMPLKEASPLNSSLHNETMKIAFILTLNGRALRQVKRLLRILYSPHHTYLIHVDARQDYLFQQLKHLELDYPNIHLTHHRKSTIWGGTSLLDVLLKAMEDLLNISSEWEFLFNLSESDFPLKPIAELEKFLAANKGRNFLKSHGRQTQQFIQKQGLDRVFHQCESRMWRVGDRLLPTGIRFDGGSDWFGLSREFVDYAVHGEDVLVQGLKRLFTYTLLPAESFFHVLVLNSHFCHTYADTNLRMTLWRRAQGCLCQHRAVVDWCGCSPMVFRTSDWNQLSKALNSRKMFFARKFDSAIDQSVINRLEEEQHGVDPISYPRWAGYWENVYHTSDTTPTSNRALLSVSSCIGQSVLSQANQSLFCELKRPRTVALTSYFHHDFYQGDLILYDVLLNGQIAQLEALVRPLNKTILSPESRLMSTLRVGSDYDPKEQTLRNRMGVLSQLSKPMAFYKWGNYPGAVVQFTWFDPELKVRAVHDVNISDTSKIGSQGLDLDAPLATGVWTLLVVLGSTKLASTEFLIVPLPDDLKDFRTAVHPDQQYWLTLLDPDHNTIAKRKQLSSFRTRDRPGYLHNLIFEFYAVESICQERLPSQCKSNSTWPLCSTTLWSSMARDPKSALIK